MTPLARSAWPADTPADVIGFFEGDRFSVRLSQDKGRVLRLSVCRNPDEQGVIRDGITWDELMAVKRECGFGQHDAVEMYPADDAVVNTANIRHLYIFAQPYWLVRR